MYKDFMANNNAGKKKAKGQVYDLPNAKRKILCKQTQKASLHRKSQYRIPEDAKRDDDDQTAASEAQTNPLV
ncbi:unnamed protein product [Rhizophagus irregularis]|nr:unnamed protein product [Rhizophagus irregularis]